MNTLAGRIKTSGEFSSVRHHTFPESSGSFAVFAAIRRAYRDRSEMTARRFPPPWSVEEQNACFVVRDYNRQPNTQSLRKSRLSLQ
jgi:hypothetical protein